MGYSGRSQPQPPLIRHTGLRYVAPVSVIVVCTPPRSVTGRTAQPSCGHRPPLFQLAMSVSQVVGVRSPGFSRVTGSSELWGAAGNKQRSHIEGRSPSDIPYRPTNEIAVHCLGIPLSPVPT